jgi:hypothetical protein
MLRVLLLALGGLTAAAQTQIDLRTQAKNVDFTAATSTKPFKTGTVLPPVCAVGEMFFKTDAPAGASLYGCTAANTWSVQGGFPNQCWYDSIDSTLKCRDTNGDVYAAVKTASSGVSNQWVDYIATTGIPHTSQPTAAAVGAVADSGLNGILYRSGLGVSAPATADNLSGPSHCQDVGYSNAYQCDLSPAIASYTTGTTYWFKGNTTNTGAATVNFSSLGPKIIKKQSNQDLAAGDIQAGQWVMVTYDGTNMQMQSPAGGASVSSIFGRSGSITAQTGDYTTAQVTESGNLYFTNARVRAALTGNGPIGFNASTGTIDCPSCATTSTPADTDLSGNFPHLSVVKLQGRPLASTAPTDQQYLGWNTSVGQWEPKSLPNLAVTSVFGRTGPITAQNGDYTTSLVSESGNLYFTNLRARTAVSGAGPIMFDTPSGTFDCPTCVTTATSADTDLSGSFPHLTVVKLRGRWVASTAPADQQYLGWNNVAGQWEPKTLAVTSVLGRTGPVTAQSGDYTTAQVTESGNLYFTNARARAALSGGGPVTINTSTGTLDCPSCVTTATSADTDLSGSFPHLSVVKLQGRVVANTAPADQQYLAWNNGAGQWEPKTLPSPPLASVFGRTGSVTAQTGDYSFAQVSGTASASQLPAIAMRADQSNTVTGGTQDFRGAAHTLPMKSGTIANLPAACTTGEAYFALDAPVGGNVYGCTATNTWSAQGGAQLLTVESDGFVVGSRATANFQTGSGMMSVIYDTGGQIDIQSALDLAVVQTQPGEQTGTALLCASTGGSSSGYQCSMNPTVAAYTTGMVLHWKPDVNGQGGPTTLNIDTLGATPVKLADGVTDPTAADLVSGRLYNVWYDGSAFRLMASGPSGTGAVSSVFGRSGSVSGQTGDYTAAQVTNAVDSTYSYSNPAWITALANSKITGLGGAALLSVGTAAGTVAAGDHTHAGVYEPVDAAIIRSGGSYSNPAWITALAWSKLTGVPSTFNAGQLQGRTLASTAPTNLQYLGWNNGASQWEPKTLPTVPTIAGTTSLLKGDGNGNAVAATSGTDFAPATPGSSILKGNGSGGFSSATAGTDYQAAGNYVTALTGDVTATGPGNAAASVVKVNGAAVPASATLVGTNGSSQIVSQTGTIANNTSGNAATVSSISSHASTELSDTAAIARNPTVTAGAGGVTQNLLVAKDTSNPTRYILPTSGMCGAGVAASTATVGNTFQLYVVPGTILTMVAQGSATAGHVALGGTTAPGEVLDSGQTSRGAIDAATCTVGTFQASATDGQTVFVKYDGVGSYGSLISSADLPAYTNRPDSAIQTGSLTVTAQAAPTITSLTPSANNSVTCTYTLTGYLADGVTYTARSTAATTAAGPTGCNSNTLVWTANASLSYYQLARTAGGSTQGLLTAMASWANNSTNCPAGVCTYVDAGGAASGSAPSTGSTGGAKLSSYFYLGGTDPSRFDIRNAANDSIAFWTAGTRWMVLPYTGKLLVGPNGDLGGGASSFNVGGNTSIGSTYYSTAAPTDGMIVQGNVGIGTTFSTGAPASKLTAVGSGTFYDPSTLGAELAASDASCTGWSPTTVTWTCSAGVLTHVAGNTTPATYTSAIYAGNAYQLAFTTASSTAGSVTPSVGGAAASAVSTNAAVTFVIGTTTTGALTLTPTSTWNGSINVQSAMSLKPPLAATVNVARTKLKPVVFADLATIPTPANGDLIYCGDCVGIVWGAAATGSGTGAPLIYVNGAWQVH